MEPVVTWREVLAALDYAEFIGKTRKWGEA